MSTRGQAPPPGVAAIPVFAKYTPALIKYSAVLLIVTIDKCYARAN